MPRFLRSLAALCVGTTFVTLLSVALGPKEGLESLGGALLAYAVFWLHMAAAPAYVVYGFRAPVLSWGYVVFMVYLAGVGASGLFVIAQTNNLDDRVARWVESTTTPANLRVRERGRALYLEYMRGDAVSADELQDWLRAAQTANDLNRRDDENHAAIWYAAALGSVEMVRTLLDSGARTDDMQLYPNSPLVAAVGQNHIAVTQLLLARGANPNAGENRDRPALTVAVRNGNLAMVELLIRSGADVNAGSPPAFSIALSSGHTDMLAVLLAHGAEPKVHWHNKHPIEVALESDHTEMVDLLLRETDGLNARSPSRPPLLFIALSECDPDAFARYLNMGANPNMTDGSGMRIVEKVLRLRTHSCDLDSLRQTFVQQLIQAGADLSAPNGRGETPALIAVHQGHLDSAARLIDADASIAGAISNQGFLTLAAQQGAAALIDEAVSRGLDPATGIDSSDRSLPLFAAISAGRSQAARQLIGYGATLPTDPNARWRWFRTATRNEDTLRVLLEHYSQLPAHQKSDREVRLAVLGSDQPGAEALLEEYGL